MTEDASSKSYAKWLVASLVMALLIYFVSAAPVLALNYKQRLPRLAWNPVNDFYAPARNIFEAPLLYNTELRWLSFWMDIIPGDLPLVQQGTGTLILIPVPASVP